MVEGVRIVEEGGAGRGASCATVMGNTALQAIPARRKIELRWPRNMSGYLYADGF